MTKSFLKFRPRILLLSTVVILMWSGLVMRFFYIQVIHSDDLRKKIEQQGENKVILSPVRGTIYDRNLQPIAENIVHYSFAVHPNQVEDKNFLCKAFSEVTGRPFEYYKKKLESDRSFVFLERNLKTSVCSSLLNIKDQGLVISRHGYRFYPHKNTISQVVGFTNVDNIGLTGIEKEYDDHLKGKKGWIILQTNGRGISQPNESYPRLDPVDGSDIILTIDLEYQAILRDELFWRIQETEAAGAMGIIVEPQTGNILAMTSLPDFDPNNRSAYPKETYKNRVIEDQIEPGSTFKIVTATAALYLNTISINDEFNCENGSYIFRGIPIKDWSDFGLLTFPQIIEHSSNVGIIKIAETLGPVNLYQFARKFGFGNSTGIRLMGEVSGKLRPPKDWSALSLAEVSLGHEVSVTALQLVYAYAAIANGGFLMKPVMVDRIVHPSGTIVYKSRPQIVRKVASREIMEELTKMLKRVVDTGTGTKAYIAGWNVAGKTGTAQKFIDGAYSNSKFISSFIGFFPIENPQMVIAIILDEPKVGYHWGGTGAAPVFREVAKRIINSDDRILVNNQKIEKSTYENNLIAQVIEKIDVENIPEIPIGLWTSSPIQIINQNKTTVKVPDVRGKSLRNAIKTIKRTGLKPKVYGSGTVVWQYPKPGTEVKKNSICQIGLE